MAPASINSGYLDKVWEMRTLGKTRDAEAKKMLEDVAKQVEPIMRKHKWQVKLLTEFSPRNPNLLGLNVGGGLEVKIRLRRHNQDNVFFPYEHILGTMLHELTHNERGPHDAHFYKLLDEVTRECEDLMAQGFGAPGHRLGATEAMPRGALSSKGLQQAAFEAAQKRAKTNQMMPAGPRRLGGDSSIKGMLTPVQAAAMAAERRMRDDLWCGEEALVGSHGGSEAAECEREASGNGVRDNSGSANLGEGRRGGGASAGNTGCTEDGSRQRGVDRRLKEGERKQVPGTSDRMRQKSRLSAEGVIDLDSWHGSGTEGRAGVEDGNGSGDGSGDGGGDGGGCCPAEGVEGSSAADVGRWSCSVCTLENKPLILQCEACGKERPCTPLKKPRPAEAHPRPAAPPQSNSVHLSKIATSTTNNGSGKGGRVWACKFCTLENPTPLSHCGACDKWRYSYGDPAATLIPNSAWT